MWIFTTCGFFSVTQSTFKPGYMQIRARDDRDLAELKTRHRLKGKIIETPGADYRWRILIRPTTAGRILAAEAEAVDYSNYKNATNDRMHARPLMSVWSAMMTVQREREAQLYPQRYPYGTGTDSTTRHRSSTSATSEQGWLFEDDTARDTDPDAAEFVRSQRRRKSRRTENQDGDETPF